MSEIVMTKKLSDFNDIPGADDIINEHLQSGAGHLTDRQKSRIHPRRFPGMSPRMAAIVGYVIGEQITDPYILDINFTSDGMAILWLSNDRRDMVPRNDLYDNWNRLLNVLREEDLELTNEDFAAYEHAFFIKFPYAL